MSAHTPGPWTVEPTWAERCDGSVGIVNREHMRDDWDVATVHSTEANARLIAAAPELLEALIELVRQHKNIRIAESYPTPNSAATDRADAAIAKATGATP